MKHCEFCDEFIGGDRNAHAQRYGHLQRKICDSGTFRLIPTLGQIVEGHLLIVPTRHYCALADSLSALDELNSLCRRVRTVLREVFGACVFFEHGIRRGGSGGCGIDHAHMHAVPVAGDGILDILTRDFHGWEIRRLTDIKEKVDPNSSYLFYEESSANRYVFPVRNLPSQYMRKLVAESIGKPDWDWRRCGREPELISTIQRLTPLLSASNLSHGV